MIKQNQLEPNQAKQSGIESNRVKNIHRFKMSHSESLQVLKGHTESCKVMQSHTMSD